VGCEPSSSKAKTGCAVQIGPYISKKKELSLKMGLILSDGAVFPGFLSAMAPFGEQTTGGKISTG